MTSMYVALCGYVRERKRGGGGVCTVLRAEELEM